MSNRPISEDHVQRAISELMRSKKIVKDDAWYSIPSALSPYPLSLTEQRGHRKHISKKKLVIARQASNMIARFSWVKLVVVTGALAMNNADESDDIDLMIVIAENRLWLVRPIVMLLTGLFFRLRRPHWSYMTYKTYVTNSICLNLWLDESALLIPKDQQNLYTAHELAQMKPIVNKDGTYERMMGENAWGRQYLANVWKRINKPINQYTNKPINQWNLFNILNATAFWFQLQYMRPKMTNERVSLHSAFFHPGDRGQTILRLYKMTLDKNKIDI